MCLQGLLRKDATGRCAFATRLDACATQLKASVLLRERVAGQASQACTPRRIHSPPRLPPCSAPTCCWTRIGGLACPTLGCRRCGQLVVGASLLVPQSSVASGPQRVADCGHLCSVLKGWRDMCTTAGMAFRARGLHMLHLAMRWAAHPSTLPLALPTPTMPGPDQCLAISHRLQPRVCCPRGAAGPALHPSGRRAQVRGMACCGAVRALVGCCCCLEGVQPAGTHHAASGSSRPAGCAAGGTVLAPSQ